MSVLCAIRDDVFSTSRVSHKTQHTLAQAGKGYLSSEKDRLLFETAVLERDSSMFPFFGLSSVFDVEYSLRIG
jgi:hypothetical protein